MSGTLVVRTLFTRSEMGKVFCFDFGLENFFSVPNRLPLKSFVQKSVQLCFLDFFKSLWYFDFNSLYLEQVKGEGKSK